jgi:hypothetical protein
MESNSLRQDLKHSIAIEVDNTSAGYLKFKGPGRSLHDNRNWEINYECGDGTSVNIAITLWAGYLGSCGTVPSQG